MAYAQMFMRDVTRFEHAYDEADAMPLGSGALAGTTYPLTATACGSCWASPA